MYAQHYEIERTHWWFRGRRRILAAIVSRLGIRTRSVLDVGCSVGVNLELLGTLDPAAMLVGLDVAYEPLRYCQTRRAAPLCQADVQDLPFADHSFDLVTALDTLEHVKDDRRVLAELFRVCRPGGHAIVSVPAFPFLWGNVDDLGHHYRRYRRRELLERVREAGFRVRFARFSNYLLFLPIAAIRVLARLRPARRPDDDTDVRSDFDMVKAGPINSLLAAIFSLEASLLALSPPFGVSLVCVASRE